MLTSAIVPVSGTRRSGPTRSPLDAERAARVRAERDFVAHELGAGLGKGGRPRTLATDPERAPISVTRALGAAIDRIGRVDAAGGAHLARAVRPGVCSYHPERTDSRPAAAMRVVVTGTWPTSARTSRTGSRPSGTSRSRWTR